MADVAEATEAATMPEPRRSLLVTHGGTSHLDDAFAYATLRLALGLREPGRDHALVRTPDHIGRTPAMTTYDIYEAAKARGLAHSLRRFSTALLGRCPQYAADTGLA